MTHRLIKDHYSKGKDKTLYGIKGDKVKMISETENVCIVENKLGNRFPIYTTNLQAI